MDLSDKLRASLKYYYEKYNSILNDSLSVTGGTDPKSAAASKLTKSNLLVPAIGWGLDRLVSITPTKFLKLFFFDEEASYSTGAKILLLSDDRSVGASEDILVSNILTDWCRPTAAFEGLSRFQLVVAIEARKLLEEGLWCTLEQLTPKVHEEYGEVTVEDWVTTAKVLIIVSNWPTSHIDGTHEPNEDEAENKEAQDALQLQRETLEYYFGELPNAKFIFVVPKLFLEDSLQMLSSISSSAVLPVKITWQLNETVQSCMLNNWVGESYWKYNLFCDWPSIMQNELSRLCETNDIFSSLSTGDFLWTISKLQIDMFRKKSHEPITICDELFKSLCHLSFDAESRPVSISQYFRNVNIPQNRVSEFLKYYLFLIPNHSPAEGYSCKFFNGQQQHLLSAWHVCSQKLSIANALKLLKERDQVGAMLVGHIRRAVHADFNLIEDKNIHRILKSIYLLSEQSKDPTAYFLLLLHELHNNQRLADILFHDAVFPRQLEIFENCLMKEPLLFFLKYVQPRRLLILVRRGEKPPELTSIIQEICGLDLSFGLGLLHHLESGNYETTDHLFRLTKTAQRGRLQDLLGCLTQTAFDMLTPSSLPFLTCIRVRVTSTEAVEKLFQVQLMLPNLMWFETDFDIALEEVTSLNLPRIVTPLCDLTFYSITNSQVNLLVHFLVQLREAYYSGLHIQDSKLSVPGTVSFLQDVFIKGIILSTPQDVIAQYRRWRYGELAVLTNDDLLEEDRVRPLLGYDDRHQYSDNEVRTSALASHIQEQNLTECISQMESLSYFQFGCRNLLLRKNADGTISQKRQSVDNSL